MALDFGALPPEIISRRMYCGPGSGPMLLAAAGWDRLAAELASTAGCYRSVIAGVTNRWRGPASVAMAGAAAPYAAWLSATAAQSEQTAGQARSAAAAYDVAVAAVVPPPVITANRALLAALTATNLVGQNTAAIAATEAAYAQMWAQDAAAMYGYAAASAAAAVLAPFPEPHPLTGPQGTATQAAAVASAVGSASAAHPQAAVARMIAALPAALHTLASPAAAADPSPLSTIIDFLTGPTSPISYFPVAGVPYLLGIQSLLLPMNAQNVAAALAATTPPAAGGAVVAFTDPGRSVISAGLGRAGLVSGLSVPPSWIAATPAAASVGAVVPSASPGGAAPGVELASGSRFSDLALASMAGRALGVPRPAGGPPAAAAGRSRPTTATIIVIPPDSE